VAQAAEYLQLAAEAGLEPKRLRFGASALLDDILAVLAGEASATQGSGY
jgi:deoxyribose-phosphate aldolase